MLIDYSFFDNWLELSAAIVGKSRDKKVRFISVPSTNLMPLALIVKEALIGELLGDGCLRYTGKIINGNPSPNKNVIFAMTLKSFEHIYYL